MKISVNNKGITTQKQELELVPGKNLDTIYDKKTDAFLVCTPDSYERLDELGKFDAGQVLVLFDKKKKTFEGMYIKSYKPILKKLKKYDEKLKFKEIKVLLALDVVSTSKFAHFFDFSLNYKFV